MPLSRRIKIPGSHPLAFRHDRAARGHLRGCLQRLPCPVRRLPTRLRIKAIKVLGSGGVGEVTLLQKRPSPTKHGKVKLLLLNGKGTFPKTVCRVEPAPFPLRIRVLRAAPRGRMLAARPFGPITCLREMLMYAVWRRCFIFFETVEDGRVHSCLKKNAPCQRKYLRVSRRLFNQCFLRNTSHAPQ